ncbi:hypothetical protein PAN31117_04814 [Pandoraea anapnoica]|uniref:Uncharacterized protein n=1 Tax=Pandoraea anapnoica TaxID=2508301 RepID=A0A5E5AJT7_9BURK|nr:hypothetical protein [Pandoraea anapnoica]VVE73949.1 hypothetical protein PAN31117_04814 [Pandoraea anapnoica]
MASFKNDVYEICVEAVKGFSGWEFSSGRFINKLKGHTNLVIYGGFGFRGDVASFYPGVQLNNKKLAKLCRIVIGEELPASIVSFQRISNSLESIPSNLRLGCDIVKNKGMMPLEDVDAAIRETFVDISDARDLFEATIRDGIRFIEAHYDLSSEEKFLSALPAKYETWHVNSPYDEWERRKGVVMCLVRMLIGDFDFVERYGSAGFETIFPKETREIELILKSLPELKGRYERTGSVV